jgi:uncharacterized repeat protein (TIGR01451 family)
VLLVDVNGNRRVDPGDRLRYTVVINNSSGADLSGLAFEETLDPNTTLVAGSLRVGPLAYPDSYAANRDTMLAIAAPGLLANDTGTPAPAVTARSVTTAAGGTATTGVDGSFSYMPPPGYTGIDSFSYSADNPAGSDTGTVTLTVRAVPVAVDDSYTIVQNSSRSIPAPGVLANHTGFPPPSVIPPFTAATTAGGSVTIAGNGGFSYSPPQSFTLTVQQGPAITSAAGASFTVGASGIFTVTTSGFPAAAITLTGALPSGVTFVDNGDGSAALGGRPGAGTEGSYPLTFGASNLFGSSAPQSFTLKVHSVILRARGGRANAAAPLSVSLGALPAGKHITITFDTLIADPLPASVRQIVNQGVVSGSGFASVLTDDPDRPGAADPTITFLGSRTVYLPLIMYGVGPPLADLVVSEITTSGGSLHVTVKNIGQLAAAESFWVDAYINPTSAPVRVNQLWNAVGNRGATWAVLGSVLPLEPGETVTLTQGDVYYRPTLSNPGGPITAGTQLYAQVDSFNATSSNGAVLETHERDGGGVQQYSRPVAAP